MKFRRLTSESEVLDVIEYQNLHGDFVTLDVETTSREARSANLLDIQITDSVDDGVAIFEGRWHSLLLKFDSKLTLVGHNCKYDIHVLFRHGTDLQDRIWRDTLLIGHLIDENRESYSLDSYVKELFNDNYKEEFWTKYKTYEEAPREEADEYACKDILYTGKLYCGLLQKLADEHIPGSLVDHVHRLQKSLLQTEITGIRVDIPYLEELGVKLKHRIDELEPKMRGCVENEIDIFELEMWSKELEKRKTDKGRAGVARPSFSFESATQLRRMLYGVLGLPEQRNDKTKAVSTDYASLEKIKSYHPVVELIQENRDLQKVYGTYVVGTLDRIDQSRIYPKFRIGGTVTGRLSHSNPNLAQLPKSGGIRGMYIPDCGRVIISADYSQLEVVVEADLTRDKTLIRMLENGESKHDVTSRELGCSRDIAKTLNFALQYWCTAGKVAKLLGVSIDEGQRVYNKYWEVYSGAKALKSKTDKMVDDGMPLQTVFGRKRRFEYKKRNQYDGDYRQAYNFLIQSTGADITSRALYLTDDWLRKTGYGNILFSVHDEILAQCKPEYAAVAENEMLIIMESVGKDVGLNIPLKAVGSGPQIRWED